MNTFKLTVLIGLFLFSFSNCKTPNDPESVAIALVKAIHNKDYKKAKSFCTSDTQYLVDKVQSYSKDTEKITNYEISVVDSKIFKDKYEGEDYAAVTISIKNDEGQEDSFTISMLKLSGNWRIKYRGSKYQLSTTN